MNDCERLKSELENHVPGKLIHACAEHALSCPELSPKGAYREIDAPLEGWKCLALKLQDELAEAKRNLIRSEVEKYRALEKLAARNLELYNEVVAMKEGCCGR